MGGQPGLMRSPWRRPSGPFEGSAEAPAETPNGSAVPVDTVESKPEPEPVSESATVQVEPERKEYEGMIPGIVLALAQLVPSILPFFTKNETAQRAAEVVTQVATSVAGTDSIEEAAGKIMADAQAKTAFQAGMLDHVAEMYKLETERLQIEKEDRDSARKMATETHDKTPTYLALGVFLVWSFIQIWLVTQGLPEGSSEAVVQRALGILDAVILAVVGFYFGSSLGSKLKTEITTRK